MYLQTEAGLLSSRAIILIEDHPNDSADWPIHYAYGSKVRVTTAEPDLVREFLEAQK